MRITDMPRRTYFESFFTLLSDLSLQRAVILMGPRRVGKTIMVYHAIHELISRGASGSDILYLSLETPVYTGMGLEQLLNFFVDIHGHGREATLFIFFDEVQYLRDWEIHLKSLVDSYPAYKFVATGSAAAALRLKSRESGAGRFSDFILPPLTFSEYLRFRNKEDELIQLKPNDQLWPVTSSIAELNMEFINYLNFGGYPEAIFSDRVREDNYQFIKSDIIDKVLLRDLPSLYGIQDIQELNRLFTTVAYNTGNEISLEGLSTSSGVAKNTIKRYLEYLEAAFLIRRVYRIDQHASRFKRATTFKVYLTNPSMRAALFGNIDIDSDEMGALTETAIYAQWLHSRSIDHLYYARWDKGEVDIVLLSSSQSKPEWAIEVKWSDLPFEDSRKIDGAIQMCESELGWLSSESNRLLVTSKTIDATKTIRSLVVRFVPSAICAYTVGFNILAHRKNEMLIGLNN